jgi:hypothetical protein
MGMQAMRRHQKRWDNHVAFEHFRHMRLCCCMSDWLSITRAQTAGRAEAACLAQELSARRCHARRAHAWQAWRDWCAAKLVQRIQLKRAASHHQGSILRSVLAAWRQQHSQSVLYQQNVLTALQHWRLRRLQACLSCWQGWAALSSRMRCDLLQPLHSNRSGGNFADAVLMQANINQSWSASAARSQQTIHDSPQAARIKEKVETEATARCTADAWSDSERIKRGTHGGCWDVTSGKAAA